MAARQVEDEPLLHVTHKAAVSCIGLFPTPQSQIKGAAGKRHFRRHSIDMTLRDSIPRSSTIFTATLRCLPASKGRLTVPCNFASTFSSSSALMSRFSFCQPSFAPAIGKNT